MKGLHDNPIILTTSPPLLHTLKRSTLIRCLPCPHRQIHMSRQAHLTVAHRVHWPAKHAPARTAILRQGSHCMRRDFLFVHDRVMTLDVSPCLVRRGFIPRSSSDSFCIPFGRFGHHHPDNFVFHNYQVPEDHRSSITSQRTVSASCCIRFPTYNPYPCFYHRSCSLYPLSLWDSVRGSYVTSCYVYLRCTVINSALAPVTVV